MKNHSIWRWSIVTLLAAVFAGAVFAQRASDQQKATNNNSGSTAELTAQVETLKAMVRELEDQLAAEQGRSSSGSMGMSGNGGMGMGQGGGGMSMSKKGAMNSDSSSGMGGPMMGGMGKGKGGMGMMGKMKGMGSMSGMGAGSSSGMNMGGMSPMSVDSTLPGFPGSSHLYHIGATGFFLDHGEHIELTTQQQTQLNGIKEKALLEQATAERNIEESEQELWELTAADEPDEKAIEAKVRAIEKQRANQRLAFFRAVGEASKVLTAEQRAALTGADASAGTSDHSSH